MIIIQTAVAKENIIEEEELVEDFGDGYFAPYQQVFGVFSQVYGVFLYILNSSDICGYLMIIMAIMILLAFEHV